MASKRFFFGWWVLGAGFIVTALVGATTSYGTALFIVPLTTEFGWTRTSFAAALSLARLESGLADPVTGFLVDRFGPRPIMFVGLAIAAAGFVLLSNFDAVVAATGLDPLLAFYLIYVCLVALGVSI